MTDELDTNKLFNQISKAMTDNDSEKLSELTAAPAPNDDDDKIVADPEQLSEDQPDDIEDPEDPDKDKPDDTEEDVEIDPQADKPADEDDANKKVKDKEPTEAEKLAEALKKIEELEKTNQNIKSQVGRVPNVQRRIRELDKKLEELSKKSSPSGQPSEAILNKIKERFKGIRSTDAELADAVEAAIADALSGVNEQSSTQEVETLRFLRDQEARSYEEAEKERFLSMYPNAPEIFRSSHWKSWKESKSDGVRALAESSSADEVALAFQLYTEDMYKQYPQLRPAAETKAKETAADPEAAKKAQQIEAERANRRKTAAQMGSKSTPTKGSIPTDPAALFDYYTKEIAKKNA